jgi:hypothetical protein
VADALKRVKRLYSDRKGRRDGSAAASRKEGSELEAKGSAKAYLCRAPDRSLPKERKKPMIFGRISTLS